MEETFSLSLPANTPDNLRSELGVKQNEDLVGDGCYVSATVHNKRYYGVLVEQAALKAASLLHFQDEASSLDLNRRMKMLLDSANEKGVNRDSEPKLPDDTPISATDDADDERKRPAEASVEEPNSKRVKLDQPKQCCGIRRQGCNRAANDTKVSIRGTRRVNTRLSHFTGDLCKRRSSVRR